MRGPHNFFRLIRTGATFERTGAMQLILDAFHVPKYAQVILRGIVWPFRWIGDPGDPSLPPAPRALSAMGPAYIKFGQVLSTRPDVVGGEMATQLRLLQDRLPPFSMEEARATIEYELEQPVEEVFSELSEPVAAASIAQVHKARLLDTGEEVAVKILRPGIERAFRRDVDTFYFAARTIDLIAPGARRLRPMDVIRHFDGVVTGELDLRLESAGAAEFAANTENDPEFRVPRIMWAKSSRRVMTMEWVDGLNATDLDALDAAGFDRKRLGANVLNHFLRHALRDGYFHADMHQGNLKIGPDGEIIALDFGIMGRIDDYTRRVYAEVLYGFIRKDYKRVAEVHFEAGYVPADKDMDAFAQALRAAVEPIFGMDASKISMGRVLQYLFEVTDRFGMVTRTELILLQRTMVVVEGVARTLDPHINIWEVSRPEVEAYIRRSIGPQALVKDLGKTALVLSRFGPKLPQMAQAALIAQNALPDNKSPRYGTRHLVLAAVVGGALVWLGSLL